MAISAPFLSFLAVNASLLTELRREYPTVLDRPSRSEGVLRPNLTILARKVATFSQNLLQKTLVYAAFPEYSWIRPFSVSFVKRPVPALGK